jgi:competence protein ComEC
VDINRAGFDELQQIIHIGPDRAEQIINLRAQRPFASVDALTRVSGIGPARLADIKAQGLACVLP